MYLKIKQENLEKLMFCVSKEILENQEKSRKNGELRENLWVFLSLSYK